MLDGGAWCLVLVDCFDVSAVLFRWSGLTSLLEALLTGTRLQAGTVTSRAEDFSSYRNAW